MSALMAGTTSWRTAWWNWLSSHMRYSGVPVALAIALPATESQEYIFTRPASSSPAQASTRWLRSISSASPPAVGNTSTGMPKWPHRATVNSCCSLSENQRSMVFFTRPSWTSGQCYGKVEAISAAAGPGGPEEEDAGEQSLDRASARCRGGLAPGVRDHPEDGRADHLRRCRAHSLQRAADDRAVPARRPRADSAGHRPAGPLVLPPP